MHLRYLWLVPLLPLAACILNALVGQRMGRAFTSLVAVVSVWAAFGLLASFALFGGGFFTATSNAYPDAQLPFLWFSIGTLQVQPGLLIDPLSIVMALIVTGVGSLIHTYSIGYMKEDPGYNRYFCYMNLFMFSMLLLVMADSFLLLFVGWELVGLCSYLLIGFWMERRSASDAARKAFIVNRVGDWAFIIGVILVFVQFAPDAGGLGALQFQSIFRFIQMHAPTVALARSYPLLPAIAILLFIGATGKSAQLPLLYVWLPDAMEGPTPVSALIHAATMVTAGVYMVVRCHVFYVLCPDVLSVVAWIGALTALFAATVAVAQTDIKRVLAYSTISQIGFMFIGAGIGQFGLGIFHLMTHAFFKALLFLGAGAVIHALHNEQDMRKMGGLARKMPGVAFMMGIGALTISGVPPFAGFWSKDAILGAAAVGNFWIWVIGSVASLLTAFYMTRLWLLVFSGEERWSESRHGGHDSKSERDQTLHPTSGWMTWPMAVLALLSTVGGVAALNGSLEHYLSPVLSDIRYVPQNPSDWPGSNVPTELSLMILAVIIALIGIALATAIYGSRSRRLSAMDWDWHGVIRFLLKGWYIDTALQGLFGRFGALFSDTVYRDIDRRFINEGAIGGLSRATCWMGRQLRKVQTGLVSDYALAMAVGVGCLMVYFLLR